MRQDADESHERLHILGCCLPNLKKITGKVASESESSPRQTGALMRQQWVNERSLRAIFQRSWGIRRPEVNMIQSLTGSPSIWQKNWAEPLIIATLLSGLASVDCPISAKIHIFGPNDCWFCIKSPSARAEKSLSKYSSWSCFHWKWIIFRSTRLKDIIKWPKVPVSPHTHTHTHHGQGMCNF